MTLCVVLPGLFTLGLRHPCPSGFDPESSEALAVCSVYVFGRADPAPTRLRVDLRTEGVCILDSRSEAGMTKYVCPWMYLVCEAIPSKVVLFASS